MKGKVWTLIHVRWDPCGQAAQPLWSGAEGQPGLIRLQQEGCRKQSQREVEKKIYTAQVSAKRGKKSLPPLQGFMMKVNEAVI